MKKTPFVCLFLWLLSLHANAGVLLTDSFSYDDGALTTNSIGKWTTHSGTSNELSVVSGKVRLSASQTEDVNAALAGQPYSAGTNVLYASFTLKALSLPNGSGSYFAHFKDGSLNFRARVWAFTNSAAAGKFRLGISSVTASISATNSTDLSVNTRCRVVTRLTLSNSVATLWIDPQSEDSPSISSAETSSAATCTAYALRQATGIGVMELDDLHVGASFADVTPELPPFILANPQGATVYAGQNVMFSVQATDSPTLSYQWQLDGNNIPGATNVTLSLTSVTVAEAGIYQVIVSNGAGAVVSDPAVLTVNAPLTGEPGFSLVHYNAKGNFASDWTTNALQVQAIARQLQYLDPDIVTFNEIPNSLRHEMTNWITAFFPDYHLAISPGTDGALRSAVMSRFLITRSNSWLDGTSLTNFGYDGTFTRDLFEAELAVPGFLEPLHIFTTHLKSGQATDESARRAAEARAISNYFVTGFLTTNGSRPYLLTGDMNEDIARPPSSNPRSIQTLVSAPVGLRLTTPLNPYTTNEMTHSIQNTNGLTKRYDYILPCGSLFSNIASSEVFRSDVLLWLPPSLFNTDSATGSDHLPVHMVFHNPFGAAPTISTNPQSQTVNEGSTANFTVSAEGTGTLTYRWMFNSVELFDDSKVDGSTTSTLSLSNVTASDAGVYAVVVSNSFGSVTSSVAVLSVVAPPTLGVGSGNLTVPLGSNATFSVTAEGTAPFFYQWQLNGIPVAGATESSYSIINAQNTQAGAYSVTISNTAGGITIGGMQLTVIVPPNAFVPVAGIYNGLFYEDSGVTHQSSGFITVNIRTNAAFSGKLQVDGDTFAFGGKFPANAMPNRVISRIKKAKSDLLLNLQLELGNKALRGTVSTPSWIAAVVTDKSTFNATNLAATYFGKYTVIFPGSTNAGEPAGHGYGTIVVRTNGKVTLAGFTSERAVIRQGTTVSQQGIWPLYSAIYPGRSVITNVTTVITNKDFKGSILGWVTFSGTPDREMNGALSWIKTGWTNAHYPQGFTNQFDLIGSYYAPPAKGTRALAITNGLLSLAGGNLAEPIVRNVFVRTNNTTLITPTNNVVKLTIAAASGLLSGSFIPEWTNRPTPLKGIVLQQQNYAAGYFLGTNLSGSMVLAPE